MITVTVKDAEGNVLFELEVTASDEFIAKAKLGGVGAEELLAELKCVKLLV